MPGAVEKAVKDAKKSLIEVPLDGTTVPHTVTATFESSTVRLIPAAPGTGIVAGAPVRAAEKGASASRSRNGSGTGSAANGSRPRPARIVAGWATSRGRRSALDVA